MRVNVCVNGDREKTERGRERERVKQGDMRFLNRRERAMAEKKEIERRERR